MLEARSVMTSGFCNQKGIKLLEERFQQLFLRRARIVGRKVPVISSYCSRQYLTFGWHPTVLKGLEDCCTNEFSKSLWKEEDREPLTSHRSRICLKILDKEHAWSNIEP
jgi:hypothetical protein